MRKIVVSVTIVAVLLGGLSFMIATQPKFPVPDKIPGINVADPAPNGCVDCHTSDKADDPLAKLTVLMDVYNKTGAPAFVKAAAQAALKAAGGDPAKITGKHPAGGAMFKGQDLPKACLQCHSGDGKSIPRLDSMLYLLKYANFKDGKFVTPATTDFVKKFGGWCTACHTLEGWKEKDGALTGKMVLKQGKEK